MRGTHRIVVVSASIGAGHDGVADELIRRLTDLGFPVDRHDFLDLLPGRFGERLRAVYRGQLSVAPRSWGWVMALQQAPWVTKRTVDLMTSLAERSMMRAVGDDALAVVSTYHLASQVLGRLRRSGRLTAPAITYLTDMSVHPMWVADGVDTHLAIHGVAATQAKVLDATDVRVIAPAVRPAFTRPGGGGAMFTLPQGKPLALIVAGSWGVGAVEQTALDIANTGLAVPVVACGRNEALYRRLGDSSHAIALGWVDDMASLMRTCHVVVQNAGGLSSLEALASGVPVITYRCLPGHGYANADGLERAGWVPWIRTVTDLAPALERVFSSPPPRIDVAPEDPETVIATAAQLRQWEVTK
jgi:UDP-N-acetylglucosamine:LPS N-acetylglucosamine transferase